MAHQKLYLIKTSPLIWFLDFEILLKYVYLPSGTLILVIEHDKIVGGVTSYWNENENMQEGRYNR